MSIHETFYLGKLPVWSRELPVGKKRAWSDHLLNVTSPDTIVYSHKGSFIELKGRDEINQHDITGHYAGMLYAKYSVRRERVRFHHELPRKKTLLHKAHEFLVGPRQAY